MKNILHIAASPRLERSHSRLLANEFISAVLARHPGCQLTEINIGAIEQTRMGEAGAAAKFKSGRKLELNREERREWDAAHAEFEHWNRADFLVISVPMWNFSMPYHLKQWIDHVMQPGWSFGVDPEKGYVPLMKGRKAMFICACGGIYDSPEMQKADFLRPYLRTWAGFHGLDYRIVSLEGTNFGEEILAANETAARRELAGLAQDDFCS